MLLFWCFTTPPPPPQKKLFSLFSMLKKTFSDSDGKSELLFLFSKVYEILFTLFFSSRTFVTFSHLGPWTCMQSHDTLMCFEVHTNTFLTILMFAGQSEPHFFSFKATVQTQIKKKLWIHVAILLFYYPGKGKKWLFLIFSAEKDLKVSYNLFFQCIWNTI